ncbi:MAG: PH domain-containing protein, partial [Chloroflexi bacterium]|nr:PH domain-containing protein [Chloroflexota bacterium]
MSAIPGDLILEPGETVLVATRPLFPWEPLVALVVAAGAGAAILARDQTALAIALGVFAVLLLVWLLVRWIPWRARWFVLTDRRVIVRWGVVNRHQSALLLDRVQDASLSRPFPLSLVRGYGVLRLESAGEHSSE